MSEITSIVLEARNESGKGACRKLRPEYTPCVFYGPEYVESVPAKVKTSDIVKIIRSGQWETQALNATLPNGKKEMCLMREVQKDFLNGNVLHIDFMQLIKGHKITVNVPVQLVGRETCKGVKLGGVIDHLLREVPMDVIPSQIPDHLVIDVSALGLGDQVQVRDLELPKEATLHVELDAVVVSLTIPRGVSEEESEAEETKEVEVVAKGKAKGEDEA